jgi:hypothetical protein
MNAPQEALLVGGLGVALLGYTGSALRLNLRTWRWQKTTATILESWVDQNGTPGDSRFVVGARFRFTHDGRPYLGDRLRFTPPSYRRRRSAAAHVSRLRPGTLVDVWYDPDRPSRVVMERAIAWPYYWAAALGLLFVSGAALPVLLGV